MKPRKFATDPNEFNKLLKEFIDEGGKIEYMYNFDSTLNEPTHKFNRKANSTYNRYAYHQVSWSH